MNNGNGFNHHGVPTPGLVHPQMQNLVQGFNGNGFNHHLPVYNPSSDDSEDEGRNNIVIEELPSDYPSDDDQEEGNFIVNESSDDSEDSHYSSEDPQDGVIDVHQPAAHDDQVEAIVIKKTDYDPQGEAIIDVHRTDDIQGGSDFDHHAAHDLQEEAIDVPQTANDPENNPYFRVVPGRNISGIVLFAVMIFFLLKRTETKSIDERNGEASIHVGDIYHREAPFLRNYAAMERDFKVFGGNAATCYHSTDHKLKRKYASEHYFFMNLRDSRFLTNDPHKAHFFFIPISCQKWGAGEKVFQTYVKSLISSYPYWNRTLGADHFFVSCHDFGSRAAEEVPFLLKNAIQLVCSPSYDSKYIPQKYVALPQILELSLPPPHGYDMWNRTIAESLPFLQCHGKLNPPRTKLGFWAGSLNSDVRRNLRQFYKGVPEFEFHFVGKMKRSSVLGAYQKESCASKFCICPRGKTQVGGVCLAESMAFGCVPVILSDYHDLPFSDILDWNGFSVIIKDDDVPNLKKTLNGIPEEKYQKTLFGRFWNSMAFQKNPQHKLVLICRFVSISSGILLLSSMMSFTWLCMSYGSAATSLGTELLENFSTRKYGSASDQYTILNCKDKQRFVNMVLHPISTPST